MAMLVARRCLEDSSSSSTTMLVDGNLQNGSKERRRSTTMEVSHGCRRWALVASTLGCSSTLVASAPAVEDGQAMV
ncbi:hypothetical protein Droror1_Dr00015225 [Drosera rotundifolia]